MLTYPGALSRRYYSPPGETAAAHLESVMEYAQRRRANLSDLFHGATAFPPLVWVRSATQSVAFDLPERDSTGRIDTKRTRCCTVRPPSWNCRAPASARGAMAGRRRCSIVSTHVRRNLFAPAAPTPNGRIQRRETSHPPAHRSRAFGPGGRSTTRLGECLYKRLFVVLPILLTENQGLSGCLRWREPVPARRTIAL